MGRSRVELFRRMYPIKEEGFELLFLEELDSWFSADIACCDACYDDFVKKWPTVYLRDIEFQQNSIPLDCFYDGSDLSQIFTEEEFLQNIERIPCPRCGAPLSGNIWPYNFQFQVPEWFEKEAEQIAHIAQETPLLLLSHPFAEKVYHEIRLISLRRAASSKITAAYYRARQLPNDLSISYSDFGPPPASFTSEGRYNNAGKPVLYLSSDKETAFLEVGGQPNAVWVAEVELLSPMRLLDLLDEDLPSDILKALVVSSLLSSPSDGEGWYRPQYVFSRFVADCAYAVGFNGLKYPSLKSPTAHNLAVFNRSDNWESVFRIRGFEAIRPLKRPSLEDRLTDEMH